MRFKIRAIVAIALLLPVLYPCGYAFAQKVGTVPLWQGGGMGSGQAPGAGGTFYPPVVPGAPTGTGTDATSGQYPQGQPGSSMGGSNRLPDVNIPRSETSLPRQPRQRGPQASSPQELALPYIEERSAFEDYVLTGTPGPLNFDIRQFGYDIFRQPGQNIAPDENLPVGPDYLVGPGDEVRVNVWGSVEGQWQAFVERDGSLSFPKIGTIAVTGLTYERLRKTLELEMQRYYTDFQMSVTLGQLRTLRVYATGNFLRPGEYFVSSMATLIDVLFQSGGPTKNGTMRNIELKRGNKTVANFDAYDLLLKGNRTHDLRLMPEDIVFVPHVGPLVGIAGNVKKPAIYELKGPTRLTDLISMAGGLRGLAFKGRVQVQRVSDNQYITALEVDLVDVQKHPEKNMQLQDGDLVKIFAVAEAKNLVTINGAVIMPGEYGITPGVTMLRDIIAKAGGPQYYASSQAELTRLIVTPNGPTTDVIGFDLQKVMEGDPVNNLVLEKNDYVLVRAIPGWRSQQGTQQLDQWQQQVMQGTAPGIFTTGPVAGSTAAGVAGPSTTGYVSLPPGSTGGAGAMAPGSPAGMASPQAPNPYGTPETVGPSSPWLLHRKVSVGGEVKYPGVYAIRPDENLSSVIQRAGGFTADAFPKGAVFTRVRVREQQQKQMDDAINKLELQLLGTSPLAGVASSAAALSDTKGAAASRASTTTAVQQKQEILATLKSLKASGRMVIKLDGAGRVMKGADDLGLEDGDTLFIPKKAFGVAIMGEVFNPTSITYIKGMGYKDYISLSGGYTAQADKDRIYIMKADGSAVPPKPGHLAWSNGSNRWEVQSGELEAGDTVVVPTNYDLFGFFEYVKGVSEIFFHIATSAGVVLLRVL
jgi:protein involved in polysaccharide export with SLBB domain